MKFHKKFWEMMATPPRILDEKMYKMGGKGHLDCYPPPPPTQQHQRVYTTVGDTIPCKRRQGNGK